MQWFLRFTRSMGFPMIMYADDDGSGDGGGVPGEGNKSQNEYVERVDPVTKTKVKIPKEFDVFLGHTIASQRNEVEGKYKPLVEQLEKEKVEFESVKAELDRIKEESMTAEQKAQNNARKVIEENNKKLKVAEGERDQFKGLYFKTVTRNAIYGAFGDTKLCNPEQTAVLFEFAGNPSMEEIVDSSGKPTGIFEPMFIMNLSNDKGEAETVKGRAAELFKKWIDQPENYHLVQNDVSPGGGSRSDRNKGGRGINYDDMSPVDALTEARRQQSK